MNLTRFPRPGSFSSSKSLLESHLRKLSTNHPSLVPSSHLVLHLNRLLLLFTTFRSNFIFICGPSSPPPQWATGSARIGLTSVVSFKSGCLAQYLVHTWKHPNVCRMHNLHHKDRLLIPSRTLYNFFHRRKICEINA